MVAASPELEAHNAIPLIVGGGNRSQAEGVVKAAKANPAYVLFDEERVVYKTYALDHVFFNMIQESAAFVIDSVGMVRVAYVTHNAMTWLSPQRLKQITDTLKDMNAPSR